MKKKVVIGLSGGVDSCISTLLLREKGFDVHAITMKIDLEDTFSSKKCLYEPKLFEEIKHFCKKFDIPHKIIDCTQDFKNQVLSYLKICYLEGLTPNPCIRCNETIKFNILYNAGMSAFKADFFATGHYAQIIQENNRFFLGKGVDPIKDQSYFLYRIPKEVLPSIIFPLGKFHKEQIKAKALELSLDVSKKKESQDLCIGDYKNHLSFFTKEGKIKYKDGKILGTHQGHWRYTIGQRKGLGIAYKHPLFVTQIHPHSNEVILGPEEDLLCTTLVLKECKNFGIPSKDIELKYRSSMTPIHGTIIEITNDTMTIKTAHPVKRPGNGQSCVLYHGDKVIAGGIISNAL